jgi:hypothetical protein
VKSIINLVGILLIIFGIIVLGYQGMTYTKKEKIAEIGDIQITANTQKTLYFPPVVGGLSLVAGVILILASRKK